MEPGERFSVTQGEGPIVALALHAGGGIRHELLEFMSLTEAERRYEEDPGTDTFAEVAPTRIVSQISRFEHDLNRVREKAVYRLPEDAWGLTIWKNSLSQDLVSRTLSYYDEFYSTVEEVLDAKVSRQGRVLVLDMHSYNHRRRGPDEPPLPQVENPTIEIDTTPSNRRRWSLVIDDLITRLRGESLAGELLDVRENIRFNGPGHFARWVAQRFPDTACVVSIEVKKLYMDEWSGRIDRRMAEEIRDILGRAAVFLADRHFPT